MKWIISTIILIFLLSFIAPKSEYSKKLKTPPGTVKLNDNLFFDKTEIGNVDWRIYEEWLRNNSNNSIVVLQNIPDSTVWITDNTTSSPYTNYYYRHPSFNNYPVVGVSYEQAIAFCKWRSDRVNELLAKDPKQNPFPSKKYRYRLPTVEEWEGAAENLDSTNIPRILRNKGTNKLKYLANFYDGKTAANLKDAMVYTAAVDSYKPNKFGVVNMIGNVSEMTATKGIAKGGNFLLPLDDCTIKGEQHYTKAAAWLGFRCVCEIVKE